MTALAHTPATVRPKEFHFPVAVEWIGERRVAAHVDGKPPIEITPPPVFRGTDPSTWSPEDFFVAAAASCLAVTFTGLAERAGVTYTSLSVAADGIAGQRSDGTRRPGRADVSRVGVARLARRNRDRGTTSIGTVTAITHSLSRRATVDVAEIEVMHARRRSEGTEAEPGSQC